MINYIYFTFYRKLPTNLQKIIKFFYFHLYYKPRALIYNNILKFYIGEIFFNFAKTDLFIDKMIWILNNHFDYNMKFQDKTMGQKIDLVKDETKGGGQKYLYILYRLLDLFNQVIKEIRNPYAHSNFIFEGIFNDTAILRVNYTPMMVYFDKHNKEYNINKLSLKKVLWDIKKVKLLNSKIKYQLNEFLKKA